MIVFNYCPPPQRGAGTQKCRCPSVCLSVRPSHFFVTLFSKTIYCRTLKLCMQPLVGVPFFRMRIAHSRTSVGSSNFFLPPSIFTCFPPNLTPTYYDFSRRPVARSYKNLARAIRNYENLYQFLYEYQENKGSGYVMKMIVCKYKLAALFF